MIEGILIFLIQAIAPAVIKGILSTAFHTISKLVPEIREAADDFSEIHNYLKNILEFLEKEENMTDGRRKLENWVLQVREKARSLEDLVDEFMSLADSRAGGGVERYAHNFIHGGPDLCRARSIAKDIRTLKAKIKDIYDERQRFNLPRSERWSASSNGTLFPQVLASLDNRENLPSVIRNKKTVVEWLTEDEERRMVVSVQGMGGLGKTTLARAVFNDAEVVKGFKYRAWLTVSQSCNADELLRSLEEQLKGGALRGLERGLSRICASNRQTVASSISHLLSDEKYLIVLDDVWSVRDVRNLFNLFPNNKRGSRILVTSRNGREAYWLVTGDHVLKDLELEPLPDEEARHLFYEAAFGSAAGCPQELEYSANKIIKMCNGLPLAIVAIGRAMAYKPRTQLLWNTTYRCLEWELGNNDVLRDMTNVLMLSYYDLPNHLKRCFLYCSLFPEDYTIKTKRLIRLWIAEGLIVEANGMTMEQAAEQYIEHLTSRSVLQVVARDEFGQPKACRLHDLMRKLAQQASSGELVVVDQGQNQPPNLIDRYCRHLSIAIPIEGKAIALNSSVLRQLRTLLVFSQDVSSLLNIVSGLKFIRVLDLRGSLISELPDQVFELFNLRYLSLRETDVRRISPELEKLHFLQTLDLWKTKIKHLPRKVLKLRHLRHLYKEDINDSELKYHNVGSILRGKDMASRIWDLSSLQTLRTVRANKELVAELRNLKQLRSLGVTDLEAKDGNALCNSIHMLENLLRLSVKSCSKTEVLKLENLSPPPQYLRKLILNGRLERVPPWFGSLLQLTKLHLFGAALEESQNLIPALQRLPNLVHLTLDEAYHSRYSFNLLFESGGFARLEVLFLKHLKGLTQLKVEKRALPKLNKMYLLCLEMLRSVEGIQHLPELQYLYLKQMPFFDLNHVGPRVCVKQI